MLFEDFLKEVPKITKQNLPGVDSHIKMEPPMRRKLIQETNFDLVRPKKSAVLILFYPKNSQTHIVLILRNSYNGVHSAQISFPGGKFEIEDLTLHQTALRETYEEIGVSSKLITVFKELTQLYIPPSNFMVQPFMGFVSDEIQFKINPDEVTQIIEFPLEILLNNEFVLIDKQTSYMDKIAVPSIAYEQFNIWGATGMILSEVKDILKSVLTI